MSGHRDILICGEMTKGKLSKITLELLGIGQRLADQLGQDLHAVLIGSEIDKKWAEECIYFGAKTVHVIDDPLFQDYLTDSYVEALERLARTLDPDIMLFGHTSMGRDAAPRLAYRLDTGVTLDCIDLTIDAESGIMRQTKPVYGGNACAVYVCRTRPQIASIRPKTMSPSERDGRREGKIVPFVTGLKAGEIRGRVVECVEEEETGISLEGADVVVCGGRGIGGPEGFEQLAELARLFKGAVGGTRPPCEDGLVPETCQIGLTGKIVSPRLYIGVALSGSSQHLAGIVGSKNIVAINRDPEANIFSIAHYGAVGDYRKILLTFVDKCKDEKTYG
jgi:electron transfer flavoprotein alpha subunit